MGLATDYRLQRGKRKMLTTEQILKNLNEACGTEIFADNVHDSVGAVLFADKAKMLYRMLMGTSNPLSCTPIDDYTWDVVVSGNPDKVRVFFTQHPEKPGKMILNRAWR